MIVKGYIVKDKLTDRKKIICEEKWDTDVCGPILSDEVDKQAWLINMYLSSASESHRDVPITIDRLSGFQTTSWSDKDYESMANLSSPCPVEGGEIITVFEAAKKLKEEMAKASSKVEVKPYNDPWGLRGDRVVVVETTINSEEGHGK
jgi:hypothetical protein